MEILFAFENQGGEVGIHIALYKVVRHLFGHFVLLTSSTCGCVVVDLFF